MDILELVHDSEGAQATQLPFAVWYSTIFTALQSACGSTILLQEVARAIWHDETQVSDSFPTSSSQLQAGMYDSSTLDIKRSPKKAANLND